ncbi:hypothetical protein O6H91_15G088300 [Diphasiastrum complanatum]|uniref:Uncharacterized protein n=1 Tax=Diphasiastrum complanatum TaxID=34168 RepID=A0ACC2BKI2_DIPCM|nr:hypothetical protein O6H91_15G088300 [Diphasiastrum complanatum]
MAVKELMLASAFNSNAPLFLPASFVSTEDFSPDWWRLVHTSPAFRDYWIRERFVGLDADADADADADDYDDGDEDDLDLEELEVVDEFMDLQMQLEEMERAVEADLLLAGEAFLAAD